MELLHRLRRFTTGDRKVAGKSRAARTSGDAGPLPGGRRWTWVAAGVAALGVVGLLVAHALLPSDEELASRMRAAAETRLGVPVSIEHAHWSLLPPSVAVDGLRTGQERPIVIGHLAARLALGPLLHKVIALERLEVADATFPAESLRAFRGRPGAAAPAAGDRIPLEHLEFRNMTWVPYSGIAVAYDGEVDFDANWRPRAASLRRPGVETPFTLSLARQGDDDRWHAQIQVGNGSADGDIALETAADGALKLTGTLAPKDIDIVTAMDTFERRSPVSGKAAGKTVLTSHGESVPELARNLRTRSDVSVAAARILRFDLDKAMSSLGKEHAGETPLDELTGRIETENTDQGMRVSYSNVKARHGKYTVSAEASVYHRHVEANGTLDIVDGAVGVPFTMSGPTDKPHVSVPPSFFAGVAVGTAIAPVVGTVIGARVGSAIGKLLKGGSNR